MNNTATPIIDGKDVDLTKYKNDTERMLETVINNMSRLITIIEHQEERLNRICDDVYKLFPSIDEIELISDSPEEEQMLIDLYTNRNESFSDDLDRYRTICSEYKDKFKDDGFEIDYEETREFAMTRLQSERLKEYA